MKKLYLLSLILVLISCKKENPNFDKIYYSTRSCFGTCSTYYLEIDKDRRFKLFAEEVFKKDTEFEDYNYELDSSKMGYFKGILSEKQFSYLNEKIQILNSENYNVNNDRLITDMPVISLLIQRGADKTCIQTNDPTKKFKKDFVFFLNDICKSKDLEKTEEFIVHYKHGCNSDEFAKDYFYKTSR